MSDQVMKLCGGTFLTLMLQIKKNRKVNNPSCLQGLVDVYFMHEDRFEDSTKSSETSSYKTCAIDHSDWLPFHNKTYVGEFDDALKNHYSEKLSLLNKMVDNCLSSKKEDREWLVRALMELITADNSIKPSAKFYVKDGKNPVQKQDMQSMEGSVCFSGFLLAVWHYIIVNVPDNKNGKNTLKEWHNANREKYTKGTFVSKIGKNVYQRVTVKEAPVEIDSGQDKGKVPEKKKPTIKTSSEILNERMLASGEVMLRTLSNAIDAMAAGLDKRIIYTSSLIDTNKAKQLQEIKEGVIDLNEEDSVFDTADRDSIYQYSGDVCFETKYDEFMNQSVQISANIMGRSIISNTTKDNWIANSVVNNILSAGVYDCVMWFKVLRATTEKVFVQILAIREG